VGKDLKKLSNEELWQLFPIILKPYNKDYPKQYKEEKKRIIQMIGKDLIKRINHIGSTAVHGMLAKPTIDILVELESEASLDLIKDKFDDDYICLEQKDAFNHKSCLFLKGYGESGFLDQVFHIHVRVLNNHKELYFRDYLKGHPHVAEKYGELKLELMKKYKHHRDNYTDAKGDFINKYTEIAKKIYPNKYKPKNV
jgi:GrpB-like predicted nucleotidyltransferase (UPF0157 family)